MLSNISCLLVGQVQKILANNTANRKGTRYTNKIRRIFLTNGSTNHFPSLLSQVSHQTSGANISTYRKTARGIPKTIRNKNNIIQPNTSKTANTKTRKPTLNMMLPTSASPPTPWHKSGNLPHARPAGSRCSSKTRSQSRHQQI